MDKIILRKTNLYREATFVQFPDGTGVVVRPVFKWKSGEGDVYHTVRDNDTLPSIAYRYYGQRTKNADELWWVIAEANIINNPFDMAALRGKELLIPNYDKVQLSFSK